MSSRRECISFFVSGGGPWAGMVRLEALYDILMEMQRLFSEVSVTPPKKTSNIREFHRINRCICIIFRGSSCWIIAANNQKYRTVSFLLFTTMQHLQNVQNSLESGIETVAFLHLLFKNALESFQKVMGVCGPKTRYLAHHVSLPTGIYSEGHFSYIFDDRLEKIRATKNERALERPAQSIFLRFFRTSNWRWYSPLDFNYDMSWIVWLLIM